MKQLFTILFLVSFIFPAFSQTECEVLLASVQGKYTGGCKSKKADGQGKAEGTDVFEGNFKSGYPSGEGTYTFKNGDYYKGNFKKGLKDGKGEFHYKKSGAEDSVVNGYWKNDAYVGTYLYPYIVGQKTDGVTRVNVKEEGGNAARIVTITSQNIIRENSLSGGVPTLPTVNFVSVDQGSFQREERQSTSKVSKVILYGVTFPFHATVTYEGQSFEILLSKEESWSIDVELNIR